MDKDNFSRYQDIGPGYYRRPDRPIFTRGNERSIVTSVFNRIAIDAASINLRHVRLDENDRFLETLDTGLNNCLSIEANTDQTGRAFITEDDHVHYLMSCVPLSRLIQLETQTVPGPMMSSCDASW